MRNHDETSLPKWAQERMSGLRRELEQERECLAMTRQVSYMALYWNWHSIEGPSFEGEEESRSVWLLDRNLPHCVCVLGRGDKLFVGRSRQEGEG